MSADDDISEGVVDENDLPRKKLSGKKLILFILIPLLLIGAGVATAFFLGVFDPKEEAHAEDSHEGAADDHAGEGDHASADGDDHGDGHETAAGGHFYAMPDMLVNLSEGGRQQRFLKISVSLELASDQDVPIIEAQLPRVTDYFQTYLRELRTDDLRGSAGVYRLRQELLRRVAASVTEIEVRDVLFREILIQ